ncbi:hypothetical protein [Methylotuvimicrobium sp. KM2]|jgi:hypothetical protein|uniref:hypothetical protein n=1 Tax=Methylotuvimicrobium sp. KM2 TaxID=3133976 RepID=UPI003101AE02
MKIKTGRIQNTVSIALAAALIGMAPLSAEARMNAETEHQPQFIYQTKSINNNIYSYLSKQAGAISLNPTLIYVNRAYGQAIHSYAHVGEETEIPLTIEYVNKAYNPAIYSYESAELKQEVNVPPTVVVD